MKKRIAVLLLALLLCGLAACGEKKGNQAPDPAATTPTVNQNISEPTMPTMNWGESEVVLPEDYFD